MNDKKPAFNYYSFLQLKAIDSIFNPTDSYQQRRICRWYSKEFSTPLHIVLAMPFTQVLTHYYEDTFSQMDRNDLIDMTIEDHLPEIEAEYDDELREWTESLVEEQNRTLAVKEKKQSLNNKVVPVNNSNPVHSNPPSQPEDISMTFKDEDFIDDDL
jgi:hypothetical protein